MPTLTTPPPPRTKSQQIAHIFDLACRIMIAPSLLGLALTLEMLRFLRDPLARWLVAGLWVSGALGLALWAGYHRLASRRPIGLRPELFWGLACAHNAIALALLYFVSTLTALWPIVIWPIVALILTAEAWHSARLEASAPSSS